jgi:hypothetical protein
MSDSVEIKRILSIDGGGIVGTFPAAFLSFLEQQIGDRPIGNYFDLIVGTSTGGIIAIGLALGMAARELLAVYEEQGPRIFGQDGNRFLRRANAAWRWGKHWFSAKHSPDPLREVLTKALGNRRIGEATTRLAVPAWNPSLQKVDEWHEADERSTPIVYSWTEPRASAGHALAIIGQGSSLQQGVDDTGLPHFQVTRWPQGATTRHEPACGAVYEPYGPVELGYITAMTAGLALDCLLGSVKEPTHRIWVCDHRFLESAGGLWTSSWEGLSCFRTEGAFITEVPWVDAPSPQSEAA